MKALLALEDGRHFEGIAFGATATRTGEICFNTSMTGYQEVLTDPSYRGQIVTMTYPLIGNYGINPLDLESNAPHVRGFVVEELCEVPSNWRSTQSLDGWLKEWDIPGIQGIDTRALTKHLRTRGAMRSVITSQASSVEEAVELARASAPMAGSDFVKEVTTVDPYLWDDESSRRWDIPNPSQGTTGGAEGVFHQLPEAKHRIVAYDFGIKRNILRRLRQEGFAVEVVPSTTSAEEVLKRKPDGVFLSNGPGDPAALGYIHEQVRKLTPHQPIFAICLGHQLLGHAFGGTTYKLKFGHRGGNQPVKDLRSGKVSITSQNHGFAVDADTLPSNVEVTHINLNDNTVEGLRHKDYPVFSVQYHPEAAPGPNDASYFFREFAQLIDEQKK
ncbi:carbamoyl-phosphate synthase small subunit [Roseimicrobium gellanilyticum]|uniref:Carbamoyl phosphate synthase small chain n=1 Tax=Roseimicrobium gellanilyticum TaxID=748857 RepID=A0A366HLJ7_9BACT|nr:glutamine-hydrolyzing carbamoyl-phosphate synthase small subunit [Roseimicrobium gellanilyticum]RBP43803.1 carbamoyl-phosphate synthase small subunit [Roseimicrobium gellanilyticum]